MAAHSETTTALASGQTNNSKSEIEQKSPLLDLPPELRNTIYNYALSENAPITIPERGTLVRPGLLYACKQSRGEAFLLYYALNTFRAVVDDNSFFMSQTWMRYLESGIRIGGLILDYHHLSPDVCRSVSWEKVVEKVGKIGRKLRRTSTETQRDVLKKQQGSALWNYLRKWSVFIVRIVTRGIPVSCIRAGPVREIAKASAASRTCAELWSGEMQGLLDIYREPRVMGKAITRYRREAGHFQEVRDKRLRKERAEEARTVRRRARGRKAGSAEGLVVKD